jgi:Family of unknown function (DUF6152)
MTESLSAIAALAALALTPLWGHHSAAAEYDASKLLVLTGTVTKVEWTNPHVFFNLDVKNSSGKVVNWRLEMASPNGLLRQRWLPYTVKRGDLVTVEAYAAKDYDAAAKTHRVKVPDGRWLFADSTGPPGPNE